MMRELGWKRDNKRGMVYDKSGRFRIFKACGGNNNVTYILEDRKERQCCLFENESLAIQHAEEVKGIDAKCKWLAERKRKISAEVAFRHVTSSGGFYYWKDAAKRKAEMAARYDRDSRIIRRDNGDR